MFTRIMTKPIISVAAGLALAGIIAGPVFAEGPPVNVKSGKFETAADKKAAKAFRMEKGYKGDIAAEELGNKLFKAVKVEEAIALKADSKSNKMTYVSENDPARHFRIDKHTGDFSFHKGFRDYSNDKPTIGLPNKDKAVDVAKKHLTDLGLMPDKVEEIIVRHVGGLMQADVSKDGLVIERDKLRTVHFGRQLNGVDVGGPGSKIVVELGTDGELISISRRWVEVGEENKKDSDFKQQSEVINSIKEKLKQDGKKAKKIDATAPDFGYFDDGNGNIEPAYFFNAELTYDSTDEKNVPKEHKEKYFGAVPALKSAKADFMQLERAGKQPEESKPVAKDRPNEKDKAND